MTFSNLIMLGWSPNSCKREKRTGIWKHYTQNLRFYSSKVF